MNQDIEKFKLFSQKKKTYTSGLKNMFVSCNIKPRTHPNESNPFWFIIQNIKKHNLCTQKQKNGPDCFFIIIQISKKNIVN